MRIAGVQMTKRRSLSAKARLAIFEAAGGICHICSGSIKAGEKWELEHIIPVAMGGEDGGDNLKPAHVKCHGAKTKDDVKAIAKAKRNEMKHKGAKPKPRQPIKSRGFEKAEKASKLPPVTERKRPMFQTAKGNDA